MNVPFFLAFPNNFFSIVISFIENIYMLLVSILGKTNQNPKPADDDQEENLNNKPNDKANTGLFGLLEDSCAFSNGHYR